MGHQAACSDSTAAAFRGVASIRARKEGPDRVIKCLVCRANKFRLCHALSQQAHSVLCHYSLTCFKQVVLLAFILLLDTEQGCGRQVGKQCYLPHSSFLFFSHI